MRASWLSHGRLQGDTTAEEKGQIALSGARIQLCDENTAGFDVGGASGSGHRHMFAFTVTPLGSPRAFLLCAASEPERYAWMEFLQRVADDCAQRIVPRVVAD